MSLVAINRHGGVAVYSQIARLLEEQIQQFYQVGDALPSEQVLAAQFAVNRHTVRRAIEQLIDNGLVERQHGRGTFVLDVPLNYAIGQITRFTETLESIGKTTRNKILRKLVVSARGGVAQRLGLPDNSAVLWIESLRYTDEQPICIISHFLPHARFPELFDEYRSGSLHEFIGRRYAIRLRRQESLITACLPQGDDATLLGMSQNRPVLRVKSVNVSEHDHTPLEYALTRFRADRIQLCIRP
jgi:GntR family transcriptional regulator, phosphonate transport system regulatory protein